MEGGSEEARERYRQAFERYLVAEKERSDALMSLANSAGWSRTRDTPGGRELWTKTLPDGRIWLADWFTVAYVEGFDKLCMPGLTPPPAA